MGQCRWHIAADKDDRKESNRKNILLRLSQVYINKYGPQKFCTTWDFFFQYDVWAPYNLSKKNYMGPIFTVNYISKTAWSGHIFKKYCYWKYKKNCVWHYVAKRMEKQPSELLEWEAKFNVSAQKIMFCAC